MNTEIELKLELSPAVASQLRALPLFAEAEKIGPTRTLENTYYDTPKLDLQAANIGLRTRRQGKVWLQTVKCAAPSKGGLSARPEWEQPFDGAFDFSAIDDEATRAHLEKHAAALGPLFSTRFRRETRRIERADGVRILLMLDKGEIIAGERREALCELELELEAGSGQAGDLLALALEFAAHLSLLPSDASKAERGYRLHAGEQQGPLRAEASPITADQSPMAAFRMLALSCLRHWQANANGAAHSDDPEFVHQLRVALRRLRSLIELFAPALPADFVDSWDARLKENARRFGSTRDLDVFEDELLRPVQPANTYEKNALKHLYKTVGKAREEARSRLASTEQGLLLLEFSAALYELHTLEKLPLSPGDTEAMNLMQFARLQLDTLRNKVRRRYVKALALVPERLHDTRIALKKLRYGLEFFAPLYAGRPFKRYVRSMTRAQNALGFINDLDTARGRLADWADDDDRLLFAYGLVCGWHGPRYHRLSRKSLVVLKPLLWEAAPWDAHEKDRE